MSFPIFFFVCACFLNLLVCVLLISCKRMLLLLMKSSFSFRAVWFGEIFLLLFCLLNKKVYSYLKAVLIGLSNTIVSILMNLCQLKYLWLTFNPPYHKKLDSLVPKSCNLITNYYIITSQVSIFRHAQILQQGHFVDEPGVQNKE